MTKDEIKEQYSMRDIVEQYDFHPNRAGFISCPFHSGDRTPSMKIYKKTFTAMPAELMGISLIS